MVEAFLGEWLRAEFRAVFPVFQGAFPVSPVFQGAFPAFPASFPASPVFPGKHRQLLAYRQAKCLVKAVHGAPNPYSGGYC